MSGEVELTSEARQKKARALFEQATNSENTPQVRKLGWKDLWMFNKTCKKNWKALGFSDREIERIKLNKPDWI